MLTITLHRKLLIQILLMIYKDPRLGPYLVFKGGTAAMMFYELPRFSVDLDFNLTDPSREEQMFRILSEELPRFGNVVEAVKKRFTLFFLIRYRKGERLVKIEISRRPVAAAWEVRQFLGVPIKVISPSDMAAGKLAALVTRKKFAARDVFDVWFFLTHNWEINADYLTRQTGMELPQALKAAIDVVAAIKPNKILGESGELFDDRQKQWIRTRLKEEALLALRLELSTVSSS